MKSKNIIYIILILIFISMSIFFRVKLINFLSTFPLFSKEGSGKILSLNEREELNLLRQKNKALELDPNDSQAYHFRGLSKNYSSDKAGACADLKKANELGYSASKAEMNKLGCK